MRFVIGLVRNRIRGRNREDESFIPVKTRLSIVEFQRQVKGGTP